MFINVQVIDTQTNKTKIFKVVLENLKLEAKSLKRNTLF